MHSDKSKKSGFDAWFPWLKPAFHSRRTVKTWLRCCVAFAAALILMVATKPSNTMGQAAFFCVIVAVMLPPSMALSVFIMASTTLLLGMLLGWAWGSAAMASALSVRSSSLLAQQQQQVQASLDPKLPVSLQIQVQTFHGAFLDPRSSAVYGVFIFLGAFGLGTLRAYLPNLGLLSIFGTIVIDVMCTTGPLIPRAQYTIAESFLIPATFYVAVAIGSLVLIFPESLSHVWLTSLVDTFWTPTLELLRLQNEALAAQPSDKESWSERLERGNALRSSLVNATEAITAQIKLIDLDCSIGRLGPSDLKKFNAELKSIMFRVVGLHSFNTIVNDTNVAKDDAFNQTQKLDRFQALQQKMTERELQHGHDLDSLVPILASSSSDLRNASESAIISVMEWIQEFNSRRWANLFRPSTEEQITQRHEKLATELKGLETALEEFRTVQRIKLIKPYEKFFDPVTRKLIRDSETFASRSLYVCFVFIDTLDAFAECMVKLLKLVIETDNQRKKAKFWFPGRISKVTENISNGDFKGIAGPFSMGTAEDPASFDRIESQDGSTTTLDADDDEEPDDRKTVEKERTAEPPKRRDPDAFPPTTMFGKAILKVAPFFRFFKSTEGIFAFRMGIVSVALWIPSVCRSSAWFYYDNKGLWALIMAQMGLALYAGDQIAGFVVRLSGTLIGLLFGMVVWYIGAGLGHGNPHGIVIATTIFISPFLFMRIAGPPQQLTFWTMIGVTIVFVVGYSWINANHFVLSNPGVGVALGWKRALLVIIGFTAAFIAMLFPNPLSSRVLVRKTLAAIVGEAGNIFAGEVEAFLAEEQRARNGVHENVEFTMCADDDLKASPKEKRTRKIGKRVVAVSTRLRYVYPSLTTAKFEPQFSGRWPDEEYRNLFRIQQRTMASLALLITSFTKLDTKWCSALVHRTPFMNPNFLSDVFTTLAILSNCLMHGQPLPAYLPKLRDRLMYHEYHAGKRDPPNFPRIATTSLPVPTEKSVKTDSSSEINAKDKAVDDELIKGVGPLNVDGSPIGIEVDDLSLDLLLDEQLPAHSTAIVALSSLVSRVDETIDIVRKLCGEATFRGYEFLQQDYLEREERAIGGGYFADGERVR